MKQRKIINDDIVRYNDSINTNITYSNINTNKNECNNNKNENEIEANSNKPKYKKPQIQHRKNISINNPLEINIEQSNNFNKYNVNMNISHINNSIGNNTKKELIEIIDKTNKVKTDKNIRRKKYININENGNENEHLTYSKEIENILMQNMKDYKLNQTKTDNLNESILQNQVKELKNRSKTMKDKLTIFLKLMKKYSSKLTTLTNLTNNNSAQNTTNLNKNKNSINKEIQSTLSQLNNMLNNPKLNEDIFDLPDITTTDLTNNNISININTTNNNNTEDNKPTRQSLTIPANKYSKLNQMTPTLSNIRNEEDNKNIINNINTNSTEFNIINNSNSHIIATEINDTFNDDKTNNNDENANNDENNYAKDIEGLINKYEEKINLLNNENQALKKTKEEQKSIQNDLFNQNLNLENEINLLKNQLNKEKMNYENILQQLDSTSKLSISLQKKVDCLEDENNILKKNCVELSQNLSKITFEKNDKAEIENELEYKNNIIKYLEGLLKKFNINPKLLSVDVYKKESLKQKRNNIRYNNHNSLGSAFNTMMNGNKKNKNIEENDININNVNTIIKKDENSSNCKSKNILDQYLDNNDNINLDYCENTNKANKGNTKKKGKVTYSNRNIDVSSLVNVSNTYLKSNTSLNSNKVRLNRAKSCEKIINSDNNIMRNLNKNNILNNQDSISKNYNAQENENSSKQYFSFYNLIQNTNNSSNSNILDTKIKYTSSDLVSPKILKSEIDDIDKEIVELQTRLKQLLNEP